MTEFIFYVVIPDLMPETELDWPDGLPLPRWGEAFKYKGAIWHISDTKWEYLKSRAGNCITYTITLGEDTE